VRYLVLSDIHSNLEALESVLEAAGEFDATLFLGDLVGYGPNPNQCTDLLLRQPNLTAVIGNHDLAALGHLDLDSFNAQAKEAALWTQSRLSESSRSYLNSLGQIEELDGLTAVHGSPSDPIWEYLETRNQAPENFARFTTPMCFNGHTHVPRVFAQDADTKKTEVTVPTSGAHLDVTDGLRRIVNPGSVGQPRDSDPRAAFGILDTDTGRFAFHRVEYDIPATQARMTEAGLPDQLAARLTFGM